MNKIATQILRNTLRGRDPNDYKLIKKDARGATLSYSGELSDMLVYFFIYLFENFAAQITRVTTHNLATLNTLTLILHFVGLHK